MNKPTTITKPLSPQSPTLFTVRLWTEECGDGSPEWRGKITNLHNREVRYFRDAETLYGVMVKMVGNFNGRTELAKESLSLPKA